MNYALILAGGVGRRTGLSTPKQFFSVKGKPLIIFTLEVFQRNPRIDGIYVSCHKEWILELEEMCEKWSISKISRIVQGGETGLASARNSIFNMRDDKIPRDSNILIHDAVRPFLSDAVLNDNINVAEKYGCALTAVDCVETLVLCEDGLSSKRVINRDYLKRIQTPQTFKLDALIELYSSTNIDSEKSPSTFSLYMQQGMPIYCSKGEERNIKITYDSDIEYLMKLLD